MKGNRRIISLLLVLLLLMSSAVYAAESSVNGVSDVKVPTLTTIGNTAICSAKVIYAGKTINATLQLWQGSNLVASWTKTGTSIVTFSENAAITHGLTYTLTLSGSVNGVQFTPLSVTKTL